MRFLLHPERSTVSPPKKEIYLNTHEYMTKVMSNLEFQRKRSAGHQDAMYRGLTTKVNFKSGSDRSSEAEIVRKMHACKRAEPTLWAPVSPIGEIP